MKKTYISPVADQLHMIEESMLAASITSIKGVEGLSISDIADDGSHTADVKANIFGDDIFE